MEVTGLNITMRNMSDHPNGLDGAIPQPYYSLHRIWRGNMMLNFRQILILLSQPKNIPFSLSLTNRSPRLIYSMYSKIITRVRT